jgi:hypothetical protein
LALLKANRIHATVSGEILGLSANQTEGGEK